MGLAAFATVNDRYVFYRHLSTDATSTELDQYGIVISGGYFVREDIELYTLYEWGTLDIASHSDLSVLTVGFTKYFNKHNLKWQNDIGYGFNPVSSGWEVDSAGWRADAPGEADRRGENGCVQFHGHCLLLDDRRPPAASTGCHLGIIGFPPMTFSL